MCRQAATSPAHSRQADRLTICCHTSLASFHAQAVCIMFDWQIATAARRDRGRQKCTTEPAEVVLLVSFPAAERLREVLRVVDEGGQRQCTAGLLHIHMRLRVRRQSCKHAAAHVNAPASDVA